jgi:glycosyltransferase involved in cell wall biosynthesis
VIDIFIPVLGRPQNVGPLIESVEAATAVDFSLVFICSSGDDDQIEACKKTGGRILIIEGGLSEYPRKMNHAFRNTDREFCLLGADDIEFQPGWDRAALKVAKRTGAGVIGTSDCVNVRDFSPHPLVRRTYVEIRGASMDGPGFLIHEGYDHNYTDVELCKLAQVRGRWAAAPDSRVCARHHTHGTAPRDATYDKGFRRFRKDRQLYLKREKTFE